MNICSAARLTSRRAFDDLRVACFSTCAGACRANRARPFAQQEGHQTPFGRLRCPLAIRGAAEHPALERRLHQVMDLVFVEGLCAQIAVSLVALERRTAERPVERVILDEAIDTQPDVVRVTRPRVISGLGYEAVAHRRMIDGPACEQKIS